LAITLGKDCTVSFGTTIASARNVTFSETARTIDINEFGVRYSSVYSTGYDATVSVELNDSADADGLFTTLQNGDEVAISGGAGSWSFTAVVTGISESCPIDGVATFTIEAKMTKDGLRQ
jgi:hypothetical protein